MPFATIFSSCGGESGFEIAFGEESRDGSAQHDRQKCFNMISRLCDDEINVTAVWSTSTIGSSNGNLELCINLAEYCSHI